MPRQSPLEEGEHAGDTDDDVMMIDEVDNKGRSSGRRDNMGRGRRSRSRSDNDKDNNNDNDYHYANNSIPQV